MGERGEGEVGGRGPGSGGKQGGMVGKDDSAIGDGRGAGDGKEGEGSCKWAPLGTTPSESPFPLSVPLDTRDCLPPSLLPPSLGCVPPSLPQICRSFPPSDIKSPLPFPSSLSHALIPSPLLPLAPCPQPERRVRSLPGGAEGGRAPLVHLRPAQRQRGDQEEAGGVLPQGVNKGVGKHGGESERQAAKPGSLARAIG